MIENFGNFWEIGQMMVYQKKIHTKLLTFSKRKYYNLVAQNVYCCSQRK